MNFDFIIPKTFYAVAFYDKINPEYQGILYSNGTEATVGNKCIPFSTKKEAEEAAENMSIRQETKIIWWNLHQASEEFEKFVK